MDEDQNMGNNLRYCTEAEIKSVKESINNSKKPDSNSFSILTVIIIVCVIVIIALVGYIYYTKYKKDHSTSKIQRRTSSDFVIYEKHRVNSLSSVSPISSIKKPTPSTTSTPYV